MTLAFGYSPREKENMAAREIRRCYLCRVEIVYVNGVGQIAAPAAEVVRYPAL
jgi:hypothetical protein